MRDFYSLIISTGRVKNIDQGVLRAIRVEKCLGAPHPLTHVLNRSEWYFALRVVADALRSPLRDGLDTEPT